MREKRREGEREREMMFATEESKVVERGGEHG